jgi:vesicle coat complex subunit
MLTSVVNREMRSPSSPVATSSSSNDLTQSLSEGDESREIDVSQGKVAELRMELSSGGKKDKNHSAKKIALKKIVANMTMSNNDMVALFPDVIGCMQINSLEIKKMYGVSPKKKCQLR